MTRAPGGRPRWKKIFSQVSSASDATQVSTKAEKATNRRRNSNQADTAKRSGIVTSPPPMTLRKVQMAVNTPLRTSSVQRSTMPSNSPMKTRFVRGASVLGVAPHGHQAGRRR